MRLWSLHPSYLDSKGIVALWREALLALAVVNGETKGYRHHPQLERFAVLNDSSGALRAYLWGVYHDACARGYSFNPEKLLDEPSVEPIPVTAGQLAYEREHLLKKLLVRDPQRIAMVPSARTLKTHPLFYSVKGPVASWEKISV